jgi:hypothetical protein
VDQQCLFLSFLLVSLQFLFITLFASRAFASHFHSSLTFVDKAGVYPSGLTISPHTHSRVLVSLFHPSLTFVDKAGSLPKE